MARLSHIRALYLITGVCGLVDAACFLSLGGVFAEIMTGNLLFLCFSLGTGKPIEGIGKYILVLAAFAVGAAAGGRLVRGSREETRIGFVVEWGLLAAALLATVAFHPGRDGPARDLVVSLLALAMGLQNALIRRHGVPDLATNVMTLTVTALIAESGLAGGRNERWQRRFGSIAVFLVSATLGAVLTSYLGPWAPLSLSLAIFTLALVGIDPRGSARP
jgi:uncharacterized membrane protein YoaK (UPF0700 family)